jgi:hypothetical protein
MANGRAVDWEDPDKSRRIQARSLDRDPIRELHQGPRSDAPHREAGHMTAPDQVANKSLNTLAGGGRPHMSYAQPVRQSGRFEIRRKSSIVWIWMSH